MTEVSWVGQGCGRLMMMTSHDEGWKNGGQSYVVFVLLCTMDLERFEMELNYYIPGMPRYSRKAGTKRGT